MLITDKVIIFPSDNGVSIIYPVDLGEKTIEEYALSIIPENTPYKIILVDEIPSDRTFRSAWEYQP